VNDDTCTYLSNGLDGTAGVCGTSCESTAAVGALGSDCRVRKETFALSDSDGKTTHISIANETLPTHLEVECYLCGSQVTSFVATTIRLTSCRVNVRIDSDVISHCSTSYVKTLFTIDIVIVNRRMNTCRSEYRRSGTVFVAPNDEMSVGKRARERKVSVDRSERDSARFGWAKLTPRS